MTIRETAIAKLQQLPDSILQEVIDYIDFVAHKHRSKTWNERQTGDSQAWERWFESVDCLSATSVELTDTSYQQLLLDKYRQQGLDL